MTAAELIAAARRLSKEAGRIRFSPPVHFVYNPLEYAREPHELYLARYATGRKRIVLLGMNPGPWGMAQTGVPFGEITMAVEWLGIRGSVKEPSGGHPRVRVQGFDCARHEVSGTRLWGLLRGRYGTAREMSKELFVSNYCPLLFLDKAGRNITPDHLARSDQPALFDACDRFLRMVIETLQPQWLVGVGRFAERRLQSVVEGIRFPGKVTSITHPSPANPKAHKDWGAVVSASLVNQHVWRR